MSLLSMSECQARERMRSLMRRHAVAALATRRFRHASDARRAAMFDALFVDAR